MNLSKAINVVERPFVTKPGMLIAVVVVVVILGILYFRKLDYLDYLVPSDISRF
jgi:hypothetical protein